MKVAIIVLNWNGADDTLACVKSLQRQTLRPNIIIVDNASSDDSVSRLEKYVNADPSDDLVLIKNDANLGFAGGINTGLRIALEEGYDYIGALNPDAVADKNWCQSLIRELNSHPAVGIATGLLLHRDGKTIDSSGDFYTTWGLPGPRNRDEPTKNAPKKPDFVFGATGGGAVYRATMFDDIDLFDEAFFMYYEDIDLSFRAQLAGFTVRFTPHAIAYHKQGASSDKVPGLAVYNTFKNLPLVFIKDVPGYLFWSVGARFFLTYWLIFFSSIKHGNGWPAFKGVLVSIVKQPTAYIKRWSIQTTRKVSVNYIEHIMHDGPLPNQTGLLKFRRFFIKK